jgi:uncharacterized protein
MAATAADEPLLVAGAALVPDISGILYWPEQRLLAVADLHLEKGSSYAERRVLLPPYDTAATLARLGQAIAAYAPRTVIALGDSFHDGRGAARLSDIDRMTLRGLQRSREWLWVLGNHDPEPAGNIGGLFAAEFRIGGLIFCHVPENADNGVIAGHLHPVARVAGRGRAVSRRCFAADKRRVVMPAFGTYTGGLNVRSPAFANIFETLDFTAHMLGQQRIYAVSAQRCLPD